MSLFDLANQFLDPLFLRVFLENVPLVHRLLNRGYSLLKLNFFGRHLTFRDVTLGFHPIGPVHLVDHTGQIRDREFELAHDGRHILL